MKVDEVLKKYSAKLEEQNEEGSNARLGGNASKEYLRFKAEMMPDLSRYERWCKSVGGMLKIKIAEKDRNKIQRNLDIAHLDVEPGEVMGLGVMGFFMFLFFGFVLSFGIMLYKNTGLTGFPFLFFMLFAIASVFCFFYFYSMPQRLANKWRLKASSQMVPCILYVVVYMKHTSNLERAIAFAAEHLEKPLALDFKKIFWDIETGKYSTIKESLDAYLGGWREYSIEFVEAFHLIESSLYEPSEERRVVILEKALQVMLDGVYDKMLKYTHSIRSPLTNLYMLGIVLPTLGLALLPLASTLLGGMINWMHVIVLFNLIIPFFVFYLTNEIMLKRPGGYGESEIMEKNPEYWRYKSKKPYWIAFFICFPFFVLGLMPFIFQYSGIPELVGLETDYSFSSIGLGFLGESKVFGFICSENEGCKGPFGVGSLIFSLFIPLSIAMFFVISYGKRTKEMIKARDYTKNLEKEFANSVFQLGNRLGDGVPAEIAFSKIAESTRGQVTENFFRTVNVNIQQMGMGLEDAIFNQKRGAIIFYPSALIATSMKILVETVKKGLGIAARSLMSISDYVKNIDKINQRLNDMLAEIVSDMKSNMTFLAPLLAGVVIGLASMLTIIMGRLREMFNSVGDASVSGIGNLRGIVELFDITQTIPPYFLQIAIGLYLIQIVFILSTTLVTVDSGEDKLKRDNVIAKNLKTTLILYSVISFLSLVVLGMISILALSSGG